MYWVRKLESWLGVVTAFIACTPATPAVAPTPAAATTRADSARPVATQDARSPNRLHECTSEQPAAAPPDAAPELTDEANTADAASSCEQECNAGVGPTLLDWSKEWEHPDAFARCQTPTGLDTNCADAVREYFREGVDDVLAWHRMCLANCSELASLAPSPEQPKRCVHDADCPATTNPCSEYRCLGKCVLQAATPEPNHCRTPDGTAARCHAGSCVAPADWATHCARWIAQHATIQWRHIGGLPSAACMRSTECRTEEARLRPEGLRDLGTRLVACLQGEVPTSVHGERLPEKHDDPEPFPERGTR